MNKEKTERNKLVIKLLKQGWSFAKVGKEVGLKSKGTVYEIWRRDHMKYSSEIKRT